MKTSKRVNTKKNITKNANVKKKRKGFTLVELLAAIAILGVIIGISIAVFIKIKNDSLQKEYENVVSYLENAAAKYARETGYTTISVSDLIDDGYAMPDDETDIYDPRTNESMNCYIIVSTFENSDYKSKLKEKLEDEDGKCKAYEKTSDYTLCKVEGNKCTEDDLKTTWFNDNITIGVRKDVGSNEILETSEDTSIRWSSTTGASGTNSTITTNVSVVSNATYKAEVIKGDTTGFGVSPVKIDKQSPVITEVSVNSDWASKKDVTVTANDFAGSGIYGIYLIKIKDELGNITAEANKECSEIEEEYTTATNNKATIIGKEEGTYKACAIDNAGNYSDDDDTKEVIVDNTDSDIDKIELTKIPEKAYATSVKLIGKARDDLSGLVAYMFSEDATKPNADDENWIELENSPIKGTEITQEKTVIENKTYYFWVKDYAGSIDEAHIIVDNVDLEVDKAEVKSSTSEYSREITLTGTTQDLKSGLGSYQFTTSSSVPSSGWQNVNESTNNKNKEKNDTYNITESKTSNGTYYFWVKDILGNTKSAKITINNIDRDIDSISINVNEGTSDNKIAVLTGVARDTQSGLVGYTFTNSSSIPTSWSTISKTTNSISYKYNVSETGTYYFWVKDAAGNTKSTSVTIESKNISSGEYRISSTYTGQTTINNIKGLTYAKVDDGYVTSKSLSNRTVTVTVDGGEKYEDYEMVTIKYSPDWDWADEECSEYSCEYGGILWGTWCVAPQDEIIEEWGDWHEIRCTYNNGYCSDCLGSANSQCKTPGYSRYDSSYGECKINNGYETIYNYDPEKTYRCTDQKMERRCTMKCEWDDDYRASCSDYNKVCNNGETLSGNYCLSCNDGGSLNDYNTCEKEEPSKYSYWTYTITVYYWY